MISFFVYQKFRTEIILSGFCDPVLFPQNAAEVVIQKQQYKREGYQHGFRHQAQDEKQKNKKISSETLMFHIIAVRSYGEHPEKVERTSLRSVIQATDSIWRGCIANRAAAKALGQMCLCHPV